MALVATLVLPLLLVDGLLMLLRLLERLKAGIHRRLLLLLNQHELLHLRCQCGHLSLKTSQLRVLRLLLHRLLVWELLLVRRLVLRLLLLRLTEVLLLQRSKPVLLLD